ncbi:hypothetical protein [Paenarthrobacter aurescens]|uniref:hypothetical protein n=1 Tax=Paenarthrobacter aurescens TaxID=43663 RepID=UPI0036731771
MTGMTILCLSCAAPLLSRSQANTVASWCVFQTRKAAGHLLVMSGVMILVHLVILTSPESAGHHGAPNAGGVVEDHHVAMLALMAVELLCLVAAAVALRLCRVAQVAARSPVASYPSSDLVENWT